MLSIYFIQSATCICGRHCRTCLWNQSYTAQGTIKCDRDLFVTICNLYWRWLVSNTSVIPVLKFTRHDKKWSRFIFYSMRPTCICGHRRTCQWNQFYTSQCTIKCCRDLLVTICDLYWRQTLSNTSVKPVLYCTSHEKVWKSWKRNTDVAEYNVLGLVPRSTRSAAAVPLEKVRKSLKKVQKSIKKLKKFEKVWKSSKTLKQFEKVRKSWRSLKKFKKVETVLKSSKKLKKFEKVEKVRKSWKSSKKCEQVEKFRKSWKKLKKFEKVWKSFEKVRKSSKKLKKFEKFRKSWKSSKKSKNFEKIEKVRKSWKSSKKYEKIWKSWKSSKMFEKVEKVRKSSKKLKKFEKVEQNWKRFEKVWKSLEKFEKVRKTWKSVEKFEIVWKVVCIKCSRNVFVTIWDLYWRWLVSITSVKPVLKFTRHDKMLSIYFIQSATCICGRHCQTCLWNQSIGEKKMR